METFDYAAISKDGVRSKGSLAAPNAREARDILRGRGLSLLQIKKARTQSSERWSYARKISHKDRTLATRQMAILLDAATPVEEAVKVTALQFEKSPMRAVLLDVRAKVLEGQRLSTALQAHPKAFPFLYRAMVSSAESSGQLAPVMERLAVDLEAAQRLRRKILAATIYPCVLTVVALLVVCILMVAVVPKVVVQFESFGQDLPGLTKAVIAVSSGFQNYGLVGAALIVAFGFGLFQLLKRPSVKLRWDRRMLRLPMIGRFARDLNAARFSRTMASLINSGTPSLPAMEAAKHTLKNTAIRASVNEAVTKVRGGVPVSQALRQTKMFPPLVTQMVAGGEAGGDVGLMFSKAADYLEEEFESTTTVFTSLLEPMIIIFLSLIVLLIIGAIFLPILQLNTLAY